MIGRLLKFLIYIAALSIIGLTVYAYLGPWFGADFSPPRDEVRQPVILDAD